jgi:molybdopterin-binding protein
MQMSEKNKISGVVRNIDFGDVTSSVEIEYEGGLITSIITTALVKGLRLRPGVYVAALIKPTDVMIVRD